MKKEPAGGRQGVEPPLCPALDCWPSPLAWSELLELLFALPLASVIKRAIRFRKVHVPGHNHIKVITRTNFQSGSDVQVLGHQLRGYLTDLLPQCFAHRAGSRWAAIGRVAAIVTSDNSPLMVRRRQLDHRIDKRADVIRVHAGCNAVAKIEHVAAAVPEARQDARDLIADAPG